MERIARRSYLVRYVVELWGAGDSLAECAASVEVPSGFRGPWRLCVARIGGGKKSRDNCSLRSCQDPAIFEAFEEALRRLRKEEPVDLSESGAAILVAMDYPQGRVYCGRVVATGAFRDLGRYDLSKRPVLGATTMDVEIAGLMARLARLERGDVVLDPFAGSCGILLATTHLTRATSYASDLDAHLLPRAAELNFFALGDLPAPTVFAPCDVRDLDDELPPHLAFDAIVTDPPYGRRASSSRARGGRGGKKSLARRPPRPRRQEAQTQRPPRLLRPPRPQPRTSRRPPRPTTDARRLRLHLPPRSGPHAAPPQLQLVPHTRRPAEEATRLGELWRRGEKCLTLPD
mmetsp:Transcript_4293/g.14231  ORF Transcript_4293/g.14231 Transcript_4293/m.14231 type:complete len:346 (-) Transcript_4293:164-1201(-)